MSVPSTIPPPGLPRRAALVATLAACLLPRPARAAAAVPEAEAFIARLGERVAAVRRERDETARRRQLGALLDEAADVPLMGRLVLGRHWRATDEAQRRAYLDLFRAYCLDGLTARLGGLTGDERVVVTGSAPAKGEDSMVSTEIIHAAPGQPPVKMDWRVRRVRGRHKIIDVVAEGVSLIVTNRTEFDTIVTRGGIDGLLAQLRAWRSGSAI